MKVLGVEVPPAEAKQEPVLDVAAIDMTDTATPVETANIRAEAPSRAAATRSKRSASRRRTKSAPGPKAKSSPDPTAKSTDGRRRARNDSVGRETFAAVEALVKKGLNKTSAFKGVADETGRSAATVASAYYRVARTTKAAKPARGRTAAQTESTSKPQRKPRSIGRSAPRKPAELAGVRDADGQQRPTIDRLGDELVRSVHALTQAVKEQTAEVSELRRRLERVRSVLD